MVMEKKFEIKEDSILKRNIAYRVRTMSKKDYLFGNNICLELNEVAAEVWDCVNGMDSVEEIIREISDEYEVNYDDIKNDIISFMKEMLEKNIFIVCE